jgi:hypothetical protein
MSDLRDMIHRSSVGMAVFTGKRFAVYDYERHCWDITGSPNGYQVPVEVTYEMRDPVTRDGDGIRRSKMCRHISELPEGATRIRLPASSRHYFGWGRDNLCRTA